jgi:hypothetical protein
MNELWKTLSHPRVATVGVLLAAIGAGFGALWMGYRTIAGTALVAAQMPYAVSAGAIGVAVIGAALGLLSVHIDRVEAAEERSQLAALRRQLREKDAG